MTITLSGLEEINDPLTDLLRRGARELIQQAVEAELSAFMVRFESRRLDSGRAAVVRNGGQPERLIQTGIGAVAVKIPKVRAARPSRSGQGSEHEHPEAGRARGARFWAALDEVYSETRQQRCWMHKTGNVLNRAPKSVHCLQKDRDELMAFYDFPTQHWQSLRKSDRVGVRHIRHRTKRSKGCLSRDGMLHMIFKLGGCAQKNWRRQRGFSYLTKVITGSQIQRWNRGEHSRPGRCLINIVNTGFDNNSV